MTARTATLAVVLAAVLPLTGCTPRERGAGGPGGGTAPTASAASTTPAGLGKVDERAVADLERTLTELEQVLAQLDAQLSVDARR